MSNLKISVIVPCYNQGHFLHQCLESLIKQKHENWECLIINDGSTDQTEEIALKWQNIDTRVKYYKKQNGGLSSARNFGLERVSGNYVQFLDCDDFLETEKFSKSLENANDNGTDIIITNFYRLQEKTQEKLPAEYQLLSEYFTLESILNNWDKTFTIPIHCALFPASLATSHRFNEQLRAKEDWLFWIEIYTHCPNTVFLNEELVCYRINPSGMTNDLAFMHEHKITALKKIKELVEDRNLYFSFLEHNNEFLLNENFELINKMAALKAKRKPRYIINKILRKLHLKK